MADLAPNDRANDLAAEPEAPYDCPLCPRLVAFRADQRAAHPTWYNGPVASFGDPAARLLIVGLAPGLKGANRTGRPFTGDFAGDLLYDTLAAYGFSAGTFRADPQDGLELVDCMITNAVRCVPPQNKPIGAEIATCRQFLERRIRGLPRLSAIVTLGRIAHDSAIRALYVVLATAAAASLLVLLALAARDFTLAYVEGRISRDLPLGFRLTAFWSGQEGSLLLWLTVLS